MDKKGKMAIIILIILVVLLILNQKFNIFEYFINYLMNLFIKK